MSILSRTLFLVAGLLVCVNVLSAPAPLLQDTSLNGAKPTQNAGSWNIMPVAPVPKEGLLQFDISAFSGTVDSATLTVNVTKLFGPGGTINVHVVRGAWNENSVTYGTRPSIDGSAATSFAVTSGDVGGSVSIDVKNIVQDWVNSPGTNFGLALLTSTANPRFGTKEGGLGASLDVVAGGDPPPPAGNTAFGIGALVSNTTGTGNTAFGFRTLMTNTEGWDNTALGRGALTKNVSGFGNTATGYAALTWNESSANTANGRYSLLSNTTGFGNTAVGERSGIANTEGEYNTAVGMSALSGNITGKHNTAVGWRALYTNETGSNNIALGNYAGRKISLSDNIIIATSGEPADSKTIRIGSAVDEIYSSAHERTFIAGIRGTTTGASDAISVVIDSNGQLGTVSSSARYKQDITDMGITSDRLLRLRPVTFRYKGAEDETGFEYGLIAEEVADVFPELVVFNDKNQPETVKYRVLSSLLLNELQKQNTTLENQASEVAELKAEVAELSKLFGEVARID